LKPLKREGILWGIKRYLAQVYPDAPRRFDHKER
jgi:hypothetical protein